MQIDAEMEVFEEQQVEIDKVSEETWEEKKYLTR